MTPSTTREQTAIRATLVTDGSSDRVLLPILEWVVAEVTHFPIRIDWADLTGVRAPPSGFRERVALAVRYFPCDLLFVHRDAEAQPPELRYREISMAVPRTPAHVAVVPVRMQEAWLLHDEASIRRAAGRPTGQNLLRLPKVSSIEREPNPKEVLHAALLSASGTTGRRRRAFDPHQVAHRLSMLISDWSPLRSLTAFQRLETDTRVALESLALPVTG